MGVTTKETLAREVSMLLELPIKGVRVSKGDKIVKAIQDSIVRGLLRDGKLYIRGFGIFRVITRPARRSPCDPSLSNRPRGQKTTIRMIPAKKIVKFFPSKVLKRMINAGTSEQ